MSGKDFNVDVTSSWFQYVSGKVMLGKDLPVEDNVT